jgi:hypothetical protein|nr:MAG TPA: hypothetical protein [Caudoviricetes sp.]
MIDEGIIKELQLLFEYISKDNNSGLIREIVKSILYQNEEFVLTSEDIQNLRKHGLDVYITDNTSAVDLKPSTDYRLFIKDKHNGVYICTISKDDFLKVCNT